MVKVMVKEEEVNEEELKVVVVSEEEEVMKEMVGKSVKKVKSEWRRK